MTPIPEPRCPACGSHLTIIPDGRVESKLRPWLTNRQPFIACDGCECIYTASGWLGYGVEPFPFRETRRSKSILKPRVSKVVNALRQRANQLEALARGQQ